MDRYDGIIFDVDGTLWDATGVAAASYNKVFEKEGLALRVTADQLKNLFGKPMDVIFALLLPELPAEEQVRLADVCMEQENEDLLTTPGTCYPEILETFQKLSERYPLFIVSNCQCGYIEAFLEYYHFWELFGDLQCFGMNQKPKGENIRILADRNGIDNVIYVGDIEGDYRACMEAGGQFIHAAYGFGTLSESIAKKTPAIRKFSELPAVIAKLVAEG
jgi:phosphoglycolate phosphatase